MKTPVEIIQETLHDLDPIADLQLLTRGFVSNGSEANAKVVVNALVGAGYVVVHRDDVVAFSTDHWRKLAERLQAYVAKHKAAVAGHQYRLAESRRRERVLATDLDLALDHARSLYQTLVTIGSCVNPPGMVDDNLNTLRFVAAEVDKALTYTSSLLVKKRLR